MKPGCCLHLSFTWSCGVSSASEKTCSSWYTDSIVPVCVTQFENRYQAPGVHRDNCTRGATRARAPSQPGAGRQLQRRTMVIPNPAVARGKGEPFTGASEPLERMA